MDHAADGDVIENSICTAWMGSDRVVWIKLEPVDHHTLEDARQLVEAHTTLAQGTPCRCMCDMRHARIGADKQARAYQVGPEAAEFKTALAMTVASPAQCLFGNLFLCLNRPPHSMKIFSQPAPALTWLKHFPGPSEP